MQRSMRSKQNINEVAYDEKSISYFKATPGSIKFDRSSANSIQETAFGIYDVTDSYMEPNKTHVLLPNRCHHDLYLTFKPSVPNS